MSKAASTNDDTEDVVQHSKCLTVSLVEWSMFVYSCVPLLDFDVLFVPSQGVRLHLHDKVESQQ